MAPAEISQHGASPRRSHSISSDRPSTTGYGGLISPPLSIRPEPAFIAASAASQIVTNDNDTQAEAWFDQHGIEPSGETALVEPPALKLVNRFLDQLLFNFLSISRSTSLASLRPAVGEVLKPKLANGAISGADQELHEYLGGGDDEELLAFHNGHEPSGNWDLELVWKRTRLRCMVYSSLGDMEEEDEDLYTEQEQLDGPPGSNNRFSNNPGVVSPAVAIFLTSVLEYMGEQVLVVAGQAAYHRLRAKHEKDDRDGTSMHPEIAERVVVEEADMERVALDRTLGRLWRGWKKRIRSPSTSVSASRPFSPESMSPQYPLRSRNASICPDDSILEDLQRASSGAAISAHEYAASIPLPVSFNDVREIEIPGLAYQSDDEEDDADDEEEEIPQKQRPKSLIVFPTIFTSHEGEEIHSPTMSQSNTPLFPPDTRRKRSHSLPSAARSVSATPSSKRPKTQTGDTKQDQVMTENVTTEDASSERVAVESEVLRIDKQDKETVQTQDQVAAKARESQVEETGNEIKQVTTKEQPHAENGDKEANEVAQKAEETQTDNSENGAEQPHESKGLIAGVIASAAAIGTAAVEGIAAAATGKAPQTKSSHKDEADVEEELSEAEILTSSRVSIGGHVSPEIPSRAPSRQTSVRSPSVHSLRVIDVPKSPGPGRPSVYSPVDLQSPRVASPVSRVANSSPIARAGSQRSSRQVRHGAEDSISEEGLNDNDSALPTDLAGAMAGVDLAPEFNQVASQTVSRDVTPQPSTFILSSPPAARAVRDASSLPVHEQAGQQISSLGLSSKAVGHDGGVPPLTPLREMMEGAPDTSDEASSIAPSHDAYSISEYGHSPSVSASSLAYQRLADSSRSVRPQAANVPRSSPPRLSREEQQQQQAKKETPKTPRPIHTSGSGSGSSSTSHKLKAVRTSEENTPTTAEDKGQSFEQLIRSDQTIQYTLTPQNMRNIEEGGPESPVTRVVAAPVIVNTHDGPRLPSSTSHSSSVNKLTSLHSNPAMETPKSVNSIKAARPSPVPTANTGARLRPNAPQPRNARIERESMGDLAEFISTTSPPGSYEKPPPQSASAVNGHRGTNGITRNASGSAPRLGTATSLPKRAESSAGRSKLLARDAVVPRGDSISDLIDFVRSGPQLEKENHRIPRTVAPFRTTMDSDQMSGAVGGKAIDASLPDPRLSQASASINSSINSQSALLAGSSKLTKSQPTQNSSNFDTEDMIPKRKTRRVRDMYQVDFSDEEEEYEALANFKPKPIKEESLAEFLANVPPPPNSSPAPIYPGGVTANAGSKMKKKSSSPSLMSRFSRKDSGPQQPPKPKSSGQDPRSGSRSSGRPQLPTHTPIAVQFTSSKPSGYEANPRGLGNDYVSQLDTARNKVAQKSYEPREAVYSSTRTNDLAAFLRSDPPSSMSTQPQTFPPSLPKEEGSTFQRMFGRRKVH